MKSDEQVEWHCINFMGKEVEVPNMAIAALPGKKCHSSNTDHYPHRTCLVQVNKDDCKSIWDGDGRTMRSANLLIAAL